MISFRNAAANENITFWWDNGNNQIAFCRGQNAFILINNENLIAKMSQKICLPPGHYCDIISGSKNGNSCTGKVIYVDADQISSVEVPLYSVIATHKGVGLFYLNLCFNLIINSIFYNFQAKLDS